MTIHTLCYLMSICHFKINREKYLEVRLIGIIFAPYIHSMNLGVDWI